MTVIFVNIQQPNLQVVAQSTSFVHKFIPIFINFEKLLSHNHSSEKYLSNMRLIVIFLLFL